MEKTTKYFTFDYKDDTTIEYVNTGAYSSLSCSFTSEDPDYGTDTIHYNMEPAVSIGKMAYEMVRELTLYLNKTDSGRYNDISHAERITYGDYSNSTLYAVEKALRNIAEEYRATSWFGNLEDVCREIAKRIIRDGNRKFSFCESDQEEWDNYSPEEYEQIGAEWYGIKRLDSVFDNGSNEYIVAVGYYGGGYVKTAYVETDKYCIGANINNLARQMCDIIKSITDSNEQSIVFAIEEAEEKEDK